MSELEVTEFWVCIECRMAREVDEWPGDVEPWPWSLITGAATPAKLTPTSVSNWESCGGETCDDEDCDEGHRDFSWSPCDACGSLLAGHRFRYAMHEVSSTAGQLVTA